MKYFMCCIRRIKHLLLLYSSCSYMTSLNFSLPPSFLSSFYVNLIFCSSFLLSPPFILLSARLSPRPRAHTVSGRMSIKSCSVNLFMGESGPAQIRTQCLVPVVIAPAPSHPAQWMTIRLPPSKAVQIIIPHSITSSLVNKLHIQESYTHLFSASSLFFFFFFFQSVYFDSECRSRSRSIGFGSRCGVVHLRKRFCLFVIRKTPSPPPPPPISPWEMFLFIFICILGIKLFHGWGTWWMANSCPRVVISFLSQDIGQILGRH